MSLTHFLRKSAPFEGKGQLCFSNMFSRVCREAHIWKCYIIVDKMGQICKWYNSTDCLECTSLILAHIFFYFGARFSHGYNCQPSFLEVVIFQFCATAFFSSKTVIPALISKQAYIIGHGDSCTKFLV